MLRMIIFLEATLLADSSLTFLLKRLDELEFENNIQTTTTTKKPLETTVETLYVVTHPRSQSCSTQTLRSYYKTLCTDKSEASEEKCVNLVETKTFNL